MSTAPAGQKGSACVWGMRADRIILISAAGGRCAPSTYKCYSRRREGLRRAGDAVSRLIREISLSKRGRSGRFSPEVSGPASMRYPSSVFALTQLSARVAVWPRTFGDQLLSINCVCAFLYVIYSQRFILIQNFPSRRKFAVFGALAGGSSSLYLSAYHGLNSAVYGNAWSETERKLVTHSHM